MFEKVIQVEKTLVEEDFTEETLLFFPDFMEMNIHSLPVSLIELTLRVIVENCSVENKPNLMQSTLQMGISVIKHFGEKHSEVIIGLLDQYLDNKKEVNPRFQNVAVILIGVCAPFIDKTSKISLISKKIIQMFETTKGKMLKSLSMCIPDLIAFFEKPDELIQSTLQKFPTEKSPDKLRGYSYLIAGNFLFFLQHYAALKLTFFH